MKWWLTSIMSLRAIPAPLWFLAAIFLLVASQIVRLQQSDPAAWIAWDYAGRIGALAALAAIPSARTVAFRPAKLRMKSWAVAVWIISIVLFDHYLCGWVRRTINAALPATVLGTYPEPHGWLQLIDDIFGLALVAYSEEIVFRRCAYHVLKVYFGDGYALVAMSSILFGAYHWWTGVGNVVEAVLMGVMLMLFYRRSGSLFPVVVSHYLTDVVDFVL